jgi:DNA modification methylase
LLGGASIHLVNTDPPYNVKVEPRSNNAIAAGLSSFPATKQGAIDAAPNFVNVRGGMHHQGFDLARDKTKSKPTTKKLRPKDRPLANDFVSDEAFDALLDAWFGNLARVLEPGRGFTSGAATPTWATSRRSSRSTGCTSRKASSGTSSIPFSPARIRGVAVWNG